VETMEDVCDRDDFSNNCVLVGYACLVDRKLFLGRKWEYAIKR
jgi:hypothetical protein